MQYADTLQAEQNWVCQFFNFSWILRKIIKINISANNICYPLTISNGVKKSGEFFRKQRIVSYGVDKLKAPPLTRFSNQQHAIVLWTLRCRRVLQKWLAGGSRLNTVAKLNCRNQVYCITPSIPRFSALLFVAKRVGVLNASNYQTAKLDYFTVGLSDWCKEKDTALWQSEKFRLLLCQTA